MVEGRFPRDLSALEPLFEFLTGFAETHGLSEPLRYRLSVALEELFTNMVKYHGGGAPEVPVRIDLADDGVRIVMEDHGVDRFDITEVPARDIDKPVAERRPGGLGIHLVRELMDEFRYEYRDRCGTITIWARLE